MFVCVHVCLHAHACVRVHACVCVPVSGWRGAYLLLDHTAEEVVPDLLSSVQSIMCERPSLWVAAQAQASEGLWPAAKQDGNSGAKKKSPWGAGSGTESTASCHLLIMMSSSGRQGGVQGWKEVGAAPPSSNSHCTFSLCTVKASTLVWHWALWWRRRNKPWRFPY